MPTGDMMKDASAWLDHIAKCSKGGIPVDELRGHMQTGARLAPFVAQLKILMQMRPEYVENQTAKKIDVEITKKYHDQMDKVKKEADSLSKVLQKYAYVISAWTQKYPKGKHPMGGVVDEFYRINGLFYTGYCSTARPEFKVIKPPRPLRADKPPPIPPRPGQHQASVQGEEDEDLYQNVEESPYNTD